MKPIRDIVVRPGEKVRDLIEQFSSVGGFMAQCLYEAAKVLTDMVKDGNCLIFLSFTANLVATGTRGVLIELIRRGFVDVVVTTAGTIDHDIARSYGGQYLVGSFWSSDLELAEKEVHRLGNVLIPRQHYGVLIERKVHELLMKVVDKVPRRVSCRKLLFEIGKLMPENSLLGICSRCRVPMYVPGFVDGAFGTALLTFRGLLRTKGRDLDLVVDPLLDEEELSSIVMKFSKLGAVVLGGGISKHHVIWWSQFSGGLDYVIYVTTASEYDGSLSGARPHEAITWGKVKRDAEVAHVVCDATIALPLLACYLIDVVGERRRRELPLEW
ncbi:MAG: deoxyhypusine synthase [Thermoprotei archaeon]|mgnify:CR=1 FL=1|nr:MAG: deoxyhypusine synthase [Thermoprotei archaeon]